MRPNGRLVAWRSPGRDADADRRRPRRGSDGPTWLTRWSRTGARSTSAAATPTGCPPASRRTRSVRAVRDRAASSGYYAPAGRDPDADIPEQYELLKAGEPYDSNPALQAAGLPDQALPLRLLRRARAGAAQAPQPRAAVDLQRVDRRPVPGRRGDSLRQADQGPASRAKLSLFFARRLRPPAGDVPSHADHRGGARQALFDRYLLGEQLRGQASRRPDLHAELLRLPGRAVQRRRNWRKQQPGEVRWPPAGRSRRLGGRRPATARAVESDRRRRRELPHRRSGRR